MATNNEIIDRGRGPEIAGTRITVYRVMDFVRAGESIATIAEHLGLTLSQAQAALDYISSHQEDVEAEYDRILSRANRGNPEWVTSIVAKSADELRARLSEKAAADGAVTTR